MRYKIQMQSANGWSDLRESSNGGPYEVCLFPTRMAAVQARAEFNELAEYLEGMRIVPAETPETENIYACNPPTPLALGGKPDRTSAQVTRLFATP